MFIEKINKQIKTDENLIINLPKENKAKLIINNDTSVLSIIDYICKNFEVANIYAATYFTNKKALEKILGFTGNFKLIAANNLLLANRSRGEWIKKNVNLKLTDTHAKCVLIRTKNNFFIISGSANMGFGRAKKLEQISIINNKVLFENIENYYKNL